MQPERTWRQFSPRGSTVEEMLPKAVVVGGQNHTKTLEEEDREPPGHDYTTFQIGSNHPRHTGSAQGRRQKHTPENRLHVTPGAGLHVS